MDLISSYHSFAWWLQRHSPGSDKFLHINAGLTLWVMAALISRRSFASWWSLLPMILIELANEAADFIDGKGWTLTDTIGDIVSTWAWPIVLVLLFRHRRKAAANATADPHPVAATPHPNGVGADRRTPATASIRSS